MGSFSTQSCTARFYEHMLRMVLSMNLYIDAKYDFRSTHISTLKKYFLNWFITVSQCHKNLL